MVEASPVVYLFHGEDEFAIAKSIAVISNKLGDEAVREANITRLDGRNLDLNKLSAHTSAMPFLAPRRLVIVDHPLVLVQQTQRKPFLDFLAGVPASTALVLVEKKLLSRTNDYDRGKRHWLEKWALENKGHVYSKRFELPRTSMPGWIQSYAKEKGGVFTPPAAMALYGLIGDDTRQAASEIEKLLDYVNFDRPVEESDVLKLTPETIEADIFKMVDALGIKDGERASRILTRLLSQQEHPRIFSMVVRQFRFLILMRELMDQNCSQQEMAQKLGFLMRPWMTKRMMAQAGKFRLTELENIYKRLLELDMDSKSSRNTIETGLFLLTAEVTGKVRPSKPRYSIYH